MVATYVTMTPYHFEDMQTIRFERSQQLDSKAAHHIAGGQHTGIVVNKAQTGDSLTMELPEMQMEFTCIMLNNRTSATHAENRRLKFWFSKGAQQFVRLNESYEFFRDIINPESFQRDYLGFIKKILKQLQGTRFPQIRRIDFDIIPLDQHQQDALVSERERRPPEQVIQESIQMLLEEAYPNVLSVDDLLRILETDDRQLLELQLDALASRDVVQCVPLEGKNVGRFGFRRKIHLQNQEVKEVKGADHMQRVSTSEKPTVAIITNLLCEKLAVDAMIEQKTTFVRYKTEGSESHVYTIGSIGPHRVISTKLPMVGRELQAKISSGSITTRLLGAFQSVQHVLLVGVGGGVPHVCEFEKHSRLGDVVVSAPLSSAEARKSSKTNERKHSLSEVDVPDDSVYIYCKQLLEMENPVGTITPYKFVLKPYKIDDPTLLGCVTRVLDRFEADPSECEWAKILDSATSMVTGDESVDFTRPAPDTDKLKLKIEDGVTFDIKHPDVPEDLKRLYPTGVPAVRLGRLGLGRPVTDNDQLRDFFAKEYQLLSYDSEYDQVLEAALGSGVRSFLIIRGIADYVEGRQGTHWQPYAALAAAAFMKSVVLELPV